MNICRLLLQCGIETCFYDDNHELRNMGAGLSNEITLNGDNVTFPDQLSVQGIVREKKRMKMTGFATLRRKFIRKRRCSKSCDHGRVIREFVSTWTPSETRSLLEEYEALAPLKDLTIQAELARPPAATYKQDLSTLYDFKYCTDVDLIFRGTCFPVHRAILSSRCSYFRELLANYPLYDAQICIDLEMPAVNVEMFSALLRYLYTGDVGPRDGDIDLAFLRQLGDELGTPNQLEQDLRYLLDTGDYADTVLIFSSENMVDVRRLSNNSEFGFRPKLELNCHKAVLSARSPFFRNLIQRRSRTGEEHTERVLHVQSRIMLDDSVIPKRYAKVLLHAIYLDTVDLSLILRGSGCTSSAGSLGEVEALTNTGRSRPTPLEEVMELYQIGRFLELEIVTQGCEDLILEWLTLETLPAVLRWGSQPHGSAWVYRQAKQFLCEEFSQLVNNPILAQLDKTHLIDCLQSDFLQASELEVLQTVLNWAENKVMKRMEDRESNMSTQASYSVNRKNARKREINDVELREILAELLPYVRVDHVIPLNNDLLNQAIRRRLVCTPPSHMMDPNSAHNKVYAWIRSPTGLFVRPRLFMPYYEEIKAIVEEQMAHGADLLKVRRVHYMPDIANTLYSDCRLRNTYSSSHSSINDMLSLASSSSSVPVPDAATMSAMIKREQKLKSAPSCQRALCLSRSSRNEINRQIRLRVVREFNLPDSVADLLETACNKCYCGNTISDEDTWTNEMSMTKASCKSGYSTADGQRVMTLPRATFQRRSKGLPAVVPEGNGYTNDVSSSSCSEGQLSDMMPDVAMASANLPLVQLSLSSNGSLSRARARPAEMELDLGDGGVSSFRRNRTTLVPPHQFI